MATFFDQADGPYIDSCLNLSTTTTVMATKPHPQLLKWPLDNSHFFTETDE